jgi:hypothetical protein
MPGPLQDAKALVLEAITQRVNKVTSAGL